MTGVYREVGYVDFFKRNTQCQRAGLWQQTGFIGARLERHMNREFDFPLVNRTTLAHQFAYRVKWNGQGNRAAPHVQIDTQCL